MVLLTAFLLFSQQVALPTPAEAASNKFYVWGEVRTPGMYRFTVSPDLVELIWTAGGPTGGADLGRVTVMRGAERKVVRINLKRMMGTGEVFTLMPGDAVVVPTSFWGRLGSAVSVATSLAVFVNLYVSVRYLLGGK